MQSKSTHFLFRIKGLIPFLLSRFLFILSAQMQFTLIVWKTYHTSKDVMYLGYLSIAELVPAFLLAFYSGYIVDRYNRKTIFNISLFSTLCSSIFLCITFLISENPTSLILVMMFVIFLSGIIRVFASSSQTALLGEIVPESQYANATTWHSGVWQVAVVTGPPLIGLFHTVIGLQMSQLFICFCMLLAWVFSLQINKKRILKTTQAKTEKFIESIKTGWRFMFNCKELLGSFTLDMFAVLFGGATSLLPIFAADVFHVGTEGLGLLRAATAMGTILIIFYLSWRPLKKNQGVLLFITIFFYGLCMIAFGTITSFWWAFAILILSGIFDGINVVIRSTILQIKTPDAVKGKVASISTLFIMSSNELGSLESSIATKLLGLHNAVIFGGIATILVVIIVYYAIPSLRKMNY